jgi:hypothetical protein
MLRKALRRLLKSPEDTYKRLISSINDEDSPEVVHIRHFLVFSIRSPQVEEIAEFVTIGTDGTPAFDP